MPTLFADISAHLLRPQGLVLALACAAASAQAQLPAKPATPQIQRQLEKSLLLNNTSNRPWTLGVYAPDTGKPPGTISASTYDRRTGRLISKGEFSPTRPVTVAPDEWVAVTPVPEKSVGSRLGVSTQAAFERRIYLKDGQGAKVDFRLTRSGNGASDGKKPKVEFTEMKDYTAYLNKVFRLESGENWLNILKPGLR